MVELFNQDFLKNKEIFENIKQQLILVLGKNVCIEHVGSTAIPNMVGKNIIDILVGAENSIQFESFLNLLTKNGYYPSLKSKTDIYQFFASKEEETTTGDIHLHLVIKNTDRFNEFILLRDYLLKNKKEAEDYSNFKNEILSSGKTYRNEYRKIKSEYVTSLIKKSKEVLKN